MRQYTRFDIKGDKLVRTNVFEDDEGRTWVTGSSHIVIDKEAFIKCFREWMSFEGEPSREGMTVLPVGNPVTDITDEFMESERMRSIAKDLNQRLKQLDYKGCYNCKYATKSKQMCDWGVNGGDGHLHFICPRWEKIESEDKK